MARITLRPDLVDRLEDIARRENRPVDAVVESLLDAYGPRGDASAEDAVRAFKQKLYRMARAYWEKVGDSERLALTDAELDAQFWLIDHEGIPRLKSEMGTVELPPDPLEAFIGLADSDATDASETVRETLDDYYRKRYGSTD